MCCEVCHDKKGANGASHGLAKSAVRDIMDRIWRGKILLFILNVVSLEQLALSI
jgi:hypothetical protein